MKRFFIFLAMTLFSLVDLPWAIYNVLVGGLIYLIGSLCRMPKLAMYGRNIALSVDQFLSAKHLGQDPDVTISMALGVAKYKHENGIAKVAIGWRYYYNFVNLLFSFQNDHVVEAIEVEESAKGTVIHLYTDVDPDWKALDKPGATPENIVKNDAA